MSDPVMDVLDLPLRCVFLWIMFLVISSYDFIEGSLFSLLFDEGFLSGGFFGF